MTTPDEEVCFITAEDIWQPTSGSRRITASASDLSRDSSRSPNARAWYGMAASIEASKAGVTLSVLSKKIQTRGPVGWTTLRHDTYQSRN